MSRAETWDGAERAVQAEGMAGAGKGPEQQIPVTLWWVQSSVLVARLRKWGSHP